MYVASSEDPSPLCGSGSRMLPKFLSTLTISWFSPLLKRGWRNPLEIDDLLPLPQHLVCESAYHAFLRGLSALPAPPASQSREIDDLPHGSSSNGGVKGGPEEPASTGQGPNPKPHSTPPPPSPEQHLYNNRALLRLIWLLHGPALRRALLFICGYQFFQFFQPVLLNVLTSQLSYGHPGKWIWILPALLFLAPLVGSLFKAQAQLSMIRIQIALRSQLTAAVYRKCLRLSAGARASLPSGRVVNLMSADVAKICDFLYPQLTFISVAPLAVVVSLTMLWFQIGWATLVGLSVLLLSTPVSNTAVRATQRHRNEMLKAADSRMKLVGQFLVGVRVIKMYHWEQPQEEAISKCRAEELRALRNMIPSKVAMQTLLYVLPQLAGVLSFLAVGLTNPSALTAARAFSSLVLFQIMRFPLLTLSTGLVELGAAIISAQRITSFMAAEEQQDYVTRLMQPTGTTPVPPPNSRRRSFSAYDRGGSGGGACVSTSPASSSAQLLLDRSLRRHSEGGLLHVMPTAAGAAAASESVGSALTPVDGAGGGPTANGVAVAGIVEAAAFAAAAGPGGAFWSRQPSMVTPRSSRALSQLATTSLAGVEPGLTIRAGGFRWAAEAMRQHEQQKRQEELDAAGDAAGGSGASRVWRRLRFRRLRSQPRPFMEIVDAAGESLASGAVALGARLGRIMTRRRDIDMTTTSPAASLLATPMHGSGITSNRSAAAAAAGDEEGLRTVKTAKDKHVDEEERVALLHSADRGVANASRGEATGVGEGCPAATAASCGTERQQSSSAGVSKAAEAAISVMVAFESASDGSSAAGKTGVSRAEVVGAVAEIAGKDTASCALRDKGDRVCGSSHSSSSASSSDPSFDEDTRTTFEVGPIDLRVRPGELVCVVGRVGSGKSSLLSAALGEMELAEDLDPKRGDVVGLGGRVAYVAQQAWIVNSSLLENVTMGKPLNEQKWSRCVEACCLGPDLKLLPAGRDTEIGEKGVNLSGGQKQRLSLARAMYQEADIYLLDDPLSAVDVHVGSHIFSQMIRGALAGAAVLLVTNAVQYLPAADNIVVLDKGNVVVQGKYQQCLEEPLFRSLLEEFKSEQLEDQQKDEGSLGQLNEQQQIGGDMLADSAVAAAAESKQRWSVYSNAVVEGDAVKSDDLSRTHQQQCSQQQSSHWLGLSTSAVAARRASVELSRRQQQLHGRCQEMAHIADLDEGNEMMDSLLRMSGSGAGDSEGLDCTAGAGDQQATEETRPLLRGAVASTRAAADDERKASGGGAAAAYSGNNSNTDTRGHGGSGGSSVRRSNDAHVGNGISKEGPTSGSKSSSCPPNAVPAEAATRGRITVVEDRELGQVKWKVYSAYIGAFHVGAAVAILLFWSAEQGTRLATNAWLARWSHSQQEQGVSSSRGSSGVGRFAAVYLVLAAAYAAATFLRSTTNNLGSYRASKILHKRTLAALMAAPLSFFEATPVGRILNRLSRDVDEMDYNLAMYQQQLGNCVMRLLATIVFLCVIQPAFIGVIVPLAIIYFVLQKYFRRSSIELQRIDSVTRSPVYANFAETMAGLDTIRAYRMQERFKLRHEAMVDTNATAYYNARVADEWLSLRLDLIGSVIVLSVAALNVGLYSLMSVPPALVALALAEAIDLTSFLNYAVKVSALVESRYNAVERLLTYAYLEPEENIEATGARGSPPYRPAGLPPWPATGELEFRDVCMSYRPGLDPVLKGVSFKIYDGQKVGIVGRTGSGKSSLIVALFRLVEPQAGQMLLDGVDLRKLGLGPARTALTAIPQEPVLFSGTMRSNLDPWDRHSDLELWMALEVVALKDYVRAMGGLCAMVSEGGGNFSVGQRQLICVARALLRKPRLLVADEATASVDPETDALIQRAIRTHFKSSSVLAIAHRLNTILDSDAVLLMDTGRVAEFGAVPELLKSPGSAFAAMVRDAGLLADAAEQRNDDA